MASLREAARKFIPVGERLSLRRFAAALGVGPPISARELIRRARPDTVDLNAVHGLRDVGRLMLQPPVDPTTGRVASEVETISLRMLQARHRFAPGQPRSFREIDRRWRASEGSKALHVLSFNTFLMNVRLNVFHVLDELLPGEDFFEVLVGAAVGVVTGGVGGALAGAVTGLKVSVAREGLEQSVGRLTAVPVRKPDVEARAPEIGAMLASERFDLAVLVEVWAEAERSGVLNGIRNAGGTTAGVAQGPLPGRTAAGSGLMTVGLTQPLGEVVFNRYSNAGAADQDSDHYAEKGALLVRVPLGFGEIDLYSTHLYFGNDLPETPVTSAPTEEQRIGWRRLQLEELRRFINSTHRPTNVAILTGDFNIDTQGRDHYGGASALTDFTRSLGLQDAWLEQFPGVPAAQGGTDCALDEERVDCVASSQTSADAQPRIDYLFVEQPTAAHTFNLDVTRIELRDFPRSLFKERQASLSDHRGLAYSLLCSTKN
jgi:hypothetical protein